MTEEFEQPGPGGWMLLGDHFPGALTAEYQRLYAETCPAGMGSYMERYGVLAKTIDVAFVHGHLYITPAPLAGPREMRRPPPQAMVWLMARVHPAFRSRNRAAKRALAERPWRAVTHHWFETERGEWIERNTTLQAVEPSSLDDRELRTHLHACRANVVAGYTRHLELHGDDLLPIGLLLARCAEWGVDAETASRALVGSSSEVTASADPADWQLVTGYDLDSLAWCELGDVKRAEPGRTPAPLDLRPLVPEDDHEELAALVADARAAVPLRDDNGVFTGAWPMGLLRRAMLEAGHRLALHDHRHAVELTVEELDQRLAGGSAPTAADAAARLDARMTDSARSAPTTLGPEFAIPPLSALPRPLGFIGAAQLAAADNMRGADAIAVGIGDAPYTGRALVVDAPTIVRHGTSCSASRARWSRPPEDSCRTRRCSHESSTFRHSSARATRTARSRPECSSPSTPRRARSPRADRSRDKGGGPVWILRPGSR